MYFLPLHPVLLKGVSHARLPPMWPGFGSWRRRHMWVEFVVDSLLCSERFFSGYSGFPLSLKTNTFKFQYIVLDYKFYLGFETEKRSASPQDRI